MEWKYVISGIAVVVLISGITIFYLSQPQTETYTVRIGYVEGIFNLHNWVATDKGFFEENGVEVEFIKFQSSDQQANALVLNEIDIAGIIASEVFLSLEDKQENSFLVFYCFTSDKNTPITHFVVKDDSVKNINDFENKNMAVFPGSMPPILNDIVLSKLGSESKFTYVPLPPPLQLEALATGQVSIANTFTPFEIMAEEKGIGHVMIPGVWETYISDPWIGSCAGFNPVFVEKHPELAKKIFISIDEAANFIQSNDNESKEILANHLPIDKKIIDKIKMPKWKKASEIKTELQTIIDILHDHGALQKRLDSSRLVYEG